MAFNLTQSGAARALDAITGRAAVAAQTEYIALLTAAPTRTTTVAGLAEVTTAGYARQQYAPTAPTAADPANTNQGAQLTFGPFTADPPNVTHAAIVTSASGTTGTVVGWWNLDAAKDVGTGDSIVVPSGQLYVTL